MQALRGAMGCFEVGIRASRVETCMVRGVVEWGGESFGKNGTTKFPLAYPLKHTHLQQQKKHCNPTTRVLFLLGHMC